MTFFVQVNIIFLGLYVLCLSPLSYCPCVFVFWSLYLVVCVKVNYVCLRVCVGMEQQGMKNALALLLLFIIKVSLFFVLFDFFVHSVPIYQYHQILWMSSSPFHGLILVCIVYVEVCSLISSKKGWMCVKGNAKFLQCQQQQ